MIPHVIAHPSRPEVLHFVYDFDAKTTLVRHRRLVDGGWQELGEHREDRLLRYPQARGEHWFVAAMPVRQFGEPAYVERWSWSPLERVESLQIEHPRFGLTALGVSASGRRAVVDRFFPTDDDAHAGARVLSLPDMAVQGDIPVISSMGSIVFDDAEEQVAMAHYDQGGCSANVYALGEGAATLVAELASDQIVTDFESACPAFLSPTRLAVWSVQNWDFAGQMGVYSIRAGEASFVTELGGSLAADDEEAFSMKIENSELAMLVRGDDVIVGGVGAIHTIDTHSGAVTTTTIEGAGAVVQVRECGEELNLVGLDHENRLFILPRSGVS